MAEPTLLESLAFQGATGALIPVVARLRGAAVLALVLVAGRGATAASPDPVGAVPDAGASAPGASVAASARTAAPANARCDDRPPPRRAARPASPAATGCAGAGGPAPATGCGPCARPCATTCDVAWTVACGPGPCQGYGPGTGPAAWAAASAMPCAACGPLMACGCETARRDGPAGTPAATPTRGAATGGSDGSAAAANVIRFELLGVKFEGSGELALMTGVLALGGILVVVVAVVTLWTTFRGGRSPAGESASTGRRSAFAGGSLAGRLGLLGIGALIVVVMFWVAARFAATGLQGAAATAVHALPAPPSWTGWPGPAWLPADDREALARLREQVASLQAAQPPRPDRPAAIPSTPGLVALALLASVAGTSLVLLLVLGRRRGWDAIGHGGSDGSPDGAAPAWKPPRAVLDALRNQRLLLQDHGDALLAALEAPVAAAAAAPRFVPSGSGSPTPAATPPAMGVVDLQAVLDDLSQVLATLESALGARADPLARFGWPVVGPDGYPVESLREMRDDLRTVLREVDRLLRADVARRLGAEPLADALRDQMRTLRDRLRPLATPR